GTSVCAECTTGETRRRRSESCTGCPEGKFDAGEFDNCIGGAYLTEPLEIGAQEVPISKDTDEAGVVLMVGDGITISSRNPGYFERFVITEKVGFGDDERRTERQEALLRKRGPFFGLDHGTNGVFRKYDAMMSACTGVNGVDLSTSYPCGCGSFQCVSGEKCDQDCGGNLTQLPSGAVFGTAGCCVGPPVSPLPTPSPTVQARGDPHLVNLQGEHFDINHGGEFDLLRIGSRRPRARRRSSRCGPPSAPSTGGRAPRTSRRWSSAARGWGPRRCRCARTSGRAPGARPTGS
ncbi:unnamed protein product, partial [Prorocentrum cordatum]